MDWELCIGLCDEGVQRLPQSIDDEANVAELLMIEGVAPAGHVTAFNTLCKQPKVDCMLKISRWL